MTTLAQAIEAREAAQPLWHGRGGWRTPCDVGAAANRLAARFTAERVALAFKDDESLAIALFAAESRSEAALLVPASWGQAEIDRYLPRAGVDLLVTDRPDLSAASVLRVSREMSSVQGAVARGTNATRWIIPTSGTTGEPKLVEHTLSSLVRTVKSDPTKGRELTWGLVYELARFAGLQVFLQAVFGGSRLIFANRETGPEALVSSLADTGCNALSATPTLWRRLMMTTESARLPLRLITLGGEIADQAILTLLASRYRDAKVLHIYASTEAGVGFSVSDRRAGFPAAFLENPPAGIELKVDANGSLWLRPAISGQRFIGEQRALVETDGWIESGDRVRRERDRFIFLGRTNGAINVGGNKVFPEEVEDCIRSVSGVLLVGVRARANPITGALVEALVKPDPTVDRVALKRSIADTCRAALAPYKVPAVVTWVDELATNATGKLMRS